MPHNHIQEASGIMQISVFLTTAVLVCVGGQVSACWGGSSYCISRWLSPRENYEKLERAVKGNKSYIKWAMRSNDANKKWALHLKNENKKLLKAMAQLSRISVQEPKMPGEVHKPTPKPPGGFSIKNPNYIQYKEKTFKHPEDTKGVIKAFETHGGEPNLKMYNAKPEGMKKDPTIGYGFSLDRSDARQTFKTVLPGVDFDRIKAGKESITKEDAQKLFDHDVDTIYQPRARNRLGANVFNKLPPNVKTAVVNAQYRGDLGPKTVGYIKNGEWNKVSTEYLNHNGYKNAPKNKMMGIVQRMNWNAKQFDSMTDKDQ